MYINGLSNTSVCDFFLLPVTVKFIKQKNVGLFSLVLLVLLLYNACV